MARWWTLTLVLLVVAGCARTGPAAGGDGVLSVAEALAAGDRADVRVRGYVLVGADRVARLCTGMAGSYPPQCGPPALEVRGLDPATLPGRESDQGLTWSAETTLTGTMTGGVLTV